MSKAPKASKAPPGVGSTYNTLSIDIGGTGLKCAVLDPKGSMLHDKVWRPTPTEASPEELVRDIEGMTNGLPAFDRVSAGFPGAVRDGRVITAPHFPHGAWAGFDLAGALSASIGKPARVLNDAEIQGFGVISGQGLEMVLTLGTGAGTALFQDGRLAPHLEFAHHPVRGKKTYNQYVGRDALKQVGSKRWNKRVRRIIEILHGLVHYDMLYIGGGNGKRIEGPLAEHVTIVSNDAGITGGIALWNARLD